MEQYWLAYPLGLFAFFFGMALIFHGFPDINIGNTTHNHYLNKDDKEKNKS